MKFTSLIFSMGVMIISAFTGGAHAETAVDRAKARQYGVDSAVANLVLEGEGVRPRLEVPITEQSLLELGAERRKNYDSFLSILEYRYGVDREVILGIWGIETRFGQNVGKTAIGPSLLKLSRTQPWKRDFAQEQLASAMRLVASGTVDHRDLVGSWAGAVGHTQFLPVSYERFAVDGDGDGKIDLWNAKDALASTANYLNAMGWHKGMIWGLAVDVPDDFYSQSQNREAHDMAYWKSAGVKPKFDQDLPDLDKAYVERFQGGDYLLTPNFFTILKYNASRDYAFSVSALGDQIYYPDRPGVKEIGETMNKGANIPSIAAPSGSSAPKGPCRSKVCGLQIKLRNAGFYKGAIDGVYGPQTRRALGRYLLSQRGRN